MPESEDIILTDEFKDALALLKSRRAIEPIIFITGRAGTGKTTLLRYFVQHSAQDAVVLAPTGIAAINVRGQTIHSFFHLQPGNLMALDDLPLLRRRIVDSFQTIIIDEASMLRADLLDAMDYILRVSSGNGLPFGGKRIILFGDLFQLPPVEENQDGGLAELFNERYASPYFFEARALREIPVEVFELKRIFRQQQDVAFVQLLNSIRDGRITQAELDAWLNPHITAQKPDQIADSIILATTNENVSWRNRRYLAGLPDKEFVYPAQISGNFSKTLPAEDELHLKKGAKIMMLNNDADKRWVNGDIGYVYDLGPDFVQVNLKGHIYEVGLVEWEQFRYEYNPLTLKLERKSKGSFTQYPVKLAWAITIHKSQGLTFENIYLDMGRGAFATGQTYVALSRCRTLSGVHLQRQIKIGDVRCDRRVQQFFRRISK